MASKHQEPEDKVVEDLYKGLRNELLNMQKKTFTKWINFHLSKADMQISDLFTDLSDGRVLMKLLEIISGEKVGKPNKGISRAHKLDNVTRCLTFLHTKVRLVNIRPRDIVDGNPHLILGLIWSVIHTFHIIRVDKATEIGDTKYDGLFGWCKVKTAGYPGVNIENFTTSWKDGLAFNALIHSHFPELIDYESLDPQDPPYNLENAFSVAERDLGVPRLLEVSDMVQPEEKSVKTYVATCFTKIKDILGKDKERRKITWVVKKLKDADDKKAEQSKFTTNLISWINDKIKELNEHEHPNTIDGVLQDLLKFKEYRTVEKPPKYNERSKIEATVFAIKTEMKNLGIPTNMLPEITLVHDIEKAWDKLEEAENNHEKALREHLYLTERQENLAYRFDKKSILCEEYLKEIMQVLTDPLYGSNLDQIDATVKKHETLSADILSREKQLENLNKICDELVKGNYHDKERIQKRERDIMKLWEEVMDLVKMHNESLQNSSKLMNLLREIDTVTTEISDIKEGMEIDNLGQHLTSVEYLLEKHNLLEADITSHGRTIEKLIKQALPFLAPKEKNATLLQKKLERLNKEYEALMSKAHHRRALLEDSHAYYQFAEDYEEQLSWIVETERLCNSPIEAQTLPAIFALQSKHKSLEMDAKNREQQIQKLVQISNTLAKNNHPQTADIKQRIKELKSHWKHLLGLLASKNQDLNQLSEILQYHADANEAESWIKEKLLLVSSEDYGADEPSSQALLRLHVRLQKSVDSYNTDVESLNNQAKKLIESLAASSPKTTEIQKAPTKEEWVEEVELVPVEEYVEKVVEKEVMKDVVVRRKVPRVRARYSFSGDDFTMKEGEEMLLLSKTNDDWWDVCKSDGQQGFAPATYVEEIEPKIIEKTIKKPVKVPEKAKVLETVMKERIVKKKKEVEPEDNSLAQASSRQFSEEIEQKQNFVNKLYHQLVKKSKSRYKHLIASIQLHGFYKEAQDFESWMKEKEATLMSSLGQKENVEMKKKVFVDFLTSLSANSKRMEEIDKMVKHLEKVKHGQLKEIKKRQKEVQDRWDELNQLKLKIQTELDDDTGVEVFHQTSDDLLDWMQEKLDALEIPKSVKDAKYIDDLQRRNKNLERETIPLEEKFNQVISLGDLAKTSSPKSKKEISAKQEKLKQILDDLKQQIAEQKALLDKSYGFQIFQNDVNRLFTWMDTVKQALYHEDPVDVATAEELQKQHQDLSDEIKAHDDDFTKVQDLGQDLLKQPENAKEVFNMLSNLQKEQQIIYQGWQEKEDYLGQCLELQLFLREAEHIDSITDDRNALLEVSSKNLGMSLDDTEALLHRHNEFIEALVRQEERVKAFSRMADKLIDNGHFNSKKIETRRDEVISARQALKDKAFHYKKILLASLAFHAFMEDVDKLSDRIQEKMKIALDQSYRDLSNLKYKLQRHHSLEAELKSNETDLKKINKKGNDLIEEKHYASEEIEAALNKLNSEWKHLCEQMAIRGHRLKQALMQQTYNQTLDSVMKKLKTIEESLNSEDVGTDLRSVKDLLSKHKKLEKDMLVQSEKVEEIVTLGKDMAKEGHFDAPNILKATEQVVKRLNSLESPLVQRQMLLEESLKFHQFQFDVEVEEQWIRERLPAASFGVVTENLTSAINLNKLHKKLEREISGHFPLIENLLSRGEELVSQEHFGSEEVQEKCEHLSENWNHLVECCSERSKKLELAIRIHQFYADTQDVEAWVNEKTDILESNDYGKDEDSAVKLLTKHRAVELEIESRVGLIKEISSQAQVLVDKDHPEAQLISNKLDLIEQMVKNLQKLASERRQKLIDSKTYFEYIRESEDFKKWIEEKMQIAKSEEYGEDYEYFLILQSKFEDFKHSMQLGVERQNQCEQLAKQLTSSESTFVRDVEARQQELEEAWESLLEHIDAREQKLVAAGEIHRFNRDVADTIVRIQEHFASIPDVLGKDIYSVQKLMLQHEHFQNNLLALEAQIHVLVDDSNSLQATYPGGNAEHIQTQMDIVIENWNILQEKALKRKDDLEASYNLQMLYSAIKDMEAWSVGLTALMQRKEKIMDVATAQWLRIEHRDLRVEIDAREEKFRAISDAAEEMIEQDHYASEEIKEHHSHLMNLKNQLEEAYYEREAYLDQIVDLQMFRRDCKQLDTLSSQQKAILETSDDSDILEEVKKLVKKHDEFEKLLDNQKEKLLLPLQQKAEQLISQNHMDSKLIQKTLDDVIARRKEIEELSKARGMRLADSLLYLQFKSLTAEARVWLSERKKRLDIEMANVNDISIEEKVKKLRKHEVFVAELLANESNIVNIKQKGELLISKSHESSLEIREKLQTLLEQWNELTNASNNLSRALQEAQDILNFLNQVEKIETWIKNKEVMILAGDTGNDYEHCVTLQNKLDDVNSDMRVDESRIDEMNNLADKLISEWRSGVSMIQEKSKAANDRWTSLQASLDEYRRKLAAALEIHAFNRDMDDINDRINEKYMLLSSMEEGKSLHATERLQRKQHMIEEDMMIIYAKLKELNKVQHNLLQKSPAESNNLRKKYSEVEDNWERLNQISNQKKEQLMHAYSLQKFIFDMQELELWVADIIDRMTSEELPTSIAECETAMQEHQEKKAEIDGRQEAFRKLRDRGHKILEQAEKSSTKKDVEESLKHLEELRLTPLKTWEEIKDILNQNYDLMVFKDQASQVEYWLSTKEAFLNNDDLGNSMASVEALLRKHDHFEKSLNAQSDKIRDLEKMVTEIVANKHYETVSIKERFKDILKRQIMLKGNMLTRRNKLNQAKELQMFLRNISEVVGWINKKIQIASDESYRDLTNLLSKIQKHATFEAEIAANKPQVDSVTTEGEALIHRGHYASEEIQTQLQKLAELWMELINQAEKKRNRLHDAYKALQFNRQLEDLEAWMMDVETQLQSEDYGKDLSSVKKLLKKHQTLEADMNGHTENIREAREMASQFINDHHFMEDEIFERINAVVNRFQALDESAQVRKENLENVLILEQFKHNVKDELTWIQQKISLASSPDFGNSVSAVKALQKKQQILEADIHNREQLITSVLSKGWEMVRSKHFAAGEVEKLLENLQNQFQELKDLARERRARLKLAEELQMFYAEAYEQESFLDENKVLLNNPDLGQDEESVNSFLKKLDVMDQDLEQFKTSMTHLFKMGEELIEKDDSDAQNIHKRVREVENLYDDVCDLAQNRREKLHGRKEYLVFLQDADELIAWIKDQITVASSDDCGTDVEHVVVLIQKFENFVASLKVKDDEIASVKNHAKKLVGDNHPDAELIKEKNAQIVQLWEELQEMIVSRLEALEGAKLVHTYDRSADETISWIQEKIASLEKEGYGHDLETIHIQIKHHETFQYNLQAVKEQVDSLGTEAHKLGTMFPEAKEHIKVTEDEVNEAWNELLKKSSERQTKLQQAEKLQVYFNEHQELLAWVNEMMARITSEELANSVDRAEALLARHRELKVEIDARREEFEQFQSSGEAIINEGHFMSTEIEQQLKQLRESFSTLLQTWSERQTLYEQNLDLQIFKRDAEKLESWLKKNEPVLKNNQMGDSLPEVERLIQKHEDFMKALEMQEENLKALKRMTLLEEAFQKQKEIEEQRAREEQQKHEQQRREAIRREEEMRMKQNREDRNKVAQGGTESRSRSGQGGALQRTESRRLSMRPASHRRMSSHRWMKTDQDLNKIDIEGYLNRKQEYKHGGKKAPVRKWKTYYSVLFKHMLCFFEDKEAFISNEASDPPVSIAGAQITEALDYTKKQNAFRITFPDGSQMLFEAYNRELMDTWIDKLLLRSRHTKTDTLTSTSSLLHQPRANSVDLSSQGSTSSSSSRENVTQEMKDISDTGKAGASSPAKPDSADKVTLRQKNLQPQAHSSRNEQAKSVGATLSDDKKNKKKKGVEKHGSFFTKMRSSKDKRSTMYN